MIEYKIGMYPLSSDLKQKIWDSILSKCKAVFFIHTKQNNIECLHFDPKDTVSLFEYKARLNLEKPM